MSTFKTPEDWHKFAKTISEKEWDEFSFYEKLSFLKVNIDIYRKRFRSESVLDKIDSLAAELEKLFEKNNPDLMEKYRKLTGKE